MKRKRTHSEYVSLVMSITSDIEIVGQYVGADTKIKHRCKVCGHEWDARPADILRRHGCPKCSYKAKTKTQEQYISELATVNPNIVVIDKYINSYTKIKHLCLKCEHEWMVNPHSLLHGNHCPQCSTRRKSHEQYVAELLINNPNIKVVGEYINANTNILHQCIVCGHKWMARPNHVLHGLGCPSCQETSGEQQVKNWLIANDIKYEYQKRFTDCKNERILPFDFYLPDYNCCIEYDGKQHFEEVCLWGGKEYLLQRQNNDQIKNDYCKKNDMYLIRIRYDEDVCEILNNALELNAFSIAL